jgi:hypothetical protein
VSGAGLASRFDNAGSSPSVMAGGYENGQRKEFCMSDDQHLQKLWTQVGDMSLETSVLATLLIHLISTEAKASPDAQAWLAKYAEDVHAWIKQPPDAPDNVKAHVEQFRGRIDVLIKAVGLRLGN